MSKFWSTGSSSSSSSDEGSSSSSSSWEEDEMDGNKICSSLNKDEFSTTNDSSSEPNAAWRRIKDTQSFIEPRKSTNANREDCTRIVCISDTHGKHREVRLPPGDILIHGGDFTKSGEVGTIQDLSHFFQESGFEEVVCIAGNHDMTLHPEYYKENWGRFHPSPFDCNAAQASVQNCIYLRDSSHKTKGGIEIHGSPWSPEFFNGAFNLPRGAPIQEIWRHIPDSTDVLITHGPPLGRGDLTPHNDYTGCYDLLVDVQERIQPRLHVFGHIHEGAGITFDGQILYVNASSLNIKYQSVNRPVVIDLPHDLSKPAMVVSPNCSMTPKDLSTWCKTHQFNRLAELLVDSALDGIPSGNELHSNEAYDMIVNHLHLHRDKGACRELRGVLSELYAESFP